MNCVRMTHAGGAAVFLLVPLLVRASLGDLCERAHLKRALDRRADANKNIVLAVSNAAATPAFMEMTSWWVKDMQKTNTPYLFMTMSDEQCEAIEILIDEALSGGAARNRKLGRHMPRCGRCESGLPPKKDRMRDHMMLMRLRYKLISDTIHLGYNGLVSDLDVVFHANPFVYFDQLKEYAMTAWMESLPVSANGGIFFARGDADPNGNERHVAKKVLSDFVRRQAWPYEHTDEMHAKIFINYGVMSAKQVAEELANKIGHSEPSLIQHVTDDQDMLQDVLDSASATGFVESRVYRALRIMLEQKRGNASGVEMVALSSRLSKAVVRAADKSEHPKFSETVGKVFGCYTDAPMEWVELRHDQHPVERLLAAPTWLVEGPGGGGHCFENSEQAPSAIRHCLGKQPECLYPKHRRAITKDPLKKSGV
jgi:hypothetical protein